MSDPDRQPITMLQAIERRRIHSWIDAFDDVVVVVSLFIVFLSDTFVENVRLFHEVLLT